MKGFCPLASGSKGNCLYLGTDKTKLLIDVGISYRALKARLEEIQVGVEEIDAILVTHEHSDHVRGIEKVSTLHDIPVFTNGETAKALLSTFKQKVRFKIFSSGESFEFGEILIHPFSVQHDTLDPVAFTLQVGELKIGICTDLGFVTSTVKKQLESCDYLYIEANHEPSMVYACSRPNIYKQRVLGRQGHLSNDMSAELIKSLVHDKLKHVFLAHLSKECNHPDLALKKVRAHLGEKVKLSIAYQEKISEVVFF